MKLTSEERKKIIIDRLMNIQTRLEHTITNHRVRSNSYSAETILITDMEMLVNRLSSLVADVRERAKNDV